MELTSPLTWIELSRSALYHNLESLAGMSSGRLMAVSVKANAYGHGLEPIVRLLVDRSEVAYVTVHSLEEAIACRAAGWPRKIMLLGPVATSDLDAIPEYDLEPTVFNRETLSALGGISKRAKKKIYTHLKLETGTHRQGIGEKELPSFATLYKKYPYLGRPLGASTHFANIEDTTQHDYADHQIKCFHRLVAQMSRLGIKPKLRHAAASAALILFDKTRFELVRPGIAVYGHWPSKETYLTYRLQGGAENGLSPVLSWKSRVTQLKDIPADSYVGYGCTYRTTSRSRLAVLPIGYWDGYDRLLSNRAFVLIRGKRAPVRGRVCMNITMVDVTDNKAVRLGDTVTLIGSEGREMLPAEQIAEWAETINYEILARLSPSIPRHLVP